MELIKLSDYENIYEVDVFEKEFHGLFSKNKAEARRYQNWLDRRLHILDESGAQATDGVLFRQLSGYNNLLYEIRYPHSKANPRVIYCILSEEGALILLAASKEKSATDITAAADRAFDRLKILEE